MAGKKFPSIRKFQSNAYTKVKYLEHDKFSSEVRLCYKGIQARSVDSSMEN
jgi:hypothetical protein